MGNIHVIINSTAGNGRGEKVGKKITARLDALKVPYKAFRTKHPGHAVDIAKEALNENSEAVLSVGGDGTAYEIAQILTGTDVPMGVIPAGTGNDFIKSLSLPSDPLKILDLILSCSPKKVDIGHINEKMFINACGVGFDASVLDNCVNAKKYFKGILPYLWGVIRTIIHYKPVMVKLNIDGRDILSKDILICSVANGKFIGGGIVVSPDSKVDDGLLNIVVVENVSRARMVGYLPGLMTGKILNFKDTTSYTGKEIAISSPEKMRFNVDGEIIPFDDVKIRITQGELNVFAP